MKPQAITPPQFHQMRPCGAAIYWTISPCPIPFKTVHWTKSQGIQAIGGAWIENFYQMQKNWPQMTLVPMKLDQETCGEVNNFLCKLKLNDLEIERGKGLWWITIKTQSRGRRNSEITKCVSFRVEDEDTTSQLKEETRPIEKFGIILM